MESFEVRVRRWAEQAHEFLSRMATDPRCPEDIRHEALRWQHACEHLGEPYQEAWWPQLGRLELRALGRVKHGHVRPEIS
jgi:hypothetical protein